jgi:hypothetical protein
MKRLRGTHDLESAGGVGVSKYQKQATERGHSRTGECIGRDKSRHGNNPTERGSLTDCRPHREGQVRTRKESDRARRTHELETASGGTSQDTERIRLSEAHSRTGDRIGRDKSGHGKNPTEQGALTNWRPHREGQVRTRKESDRARLTHFLETASGGTSQDTETIRPSEAHSRTGDHIGRDKSGHGKNPTKRGTLTYWRPHLEGQVRTRKESDRARHTHMLETASGGTSQDTERIRPSKAHSRTGDHIGRDKSGHGKNPTERGSLTSWRPHREGQVRTRKESDQTRHTDQLETASGGTSQDTERVRPSEAHSPTGDRIGRDKSGHRKNPTE